MTYTVEFERSARKELLALHASVRERILTALERLAADPFEAPNVKTLKGGQFFRLRVGDYRVIYSIEAEALMVLVVRVAHRREAYRD